jgi:uncharacterized membrane protein YccC
VESDPHKADVSLNVAKFTKMTLIRDKEFLGALGAFARINTFTSFFEDVWAGARIEQAPRIIAAMLGLAGPLAVGAMVGRVEVGMAASLGGLAMSGGGKGETFREDARRMIYGLGAGGAAMLTGSAIAGHDILTAFGIPAIAGVAGLLGSISRPLARATTQFILYTIIAANIDAPTTHPIGMLLLFSMGAAGTAGLSLGLSSIFRAMRPLSHTPTSVAPSPRYTARQLLRRWRKSLAHLSGWQYVLRITPCLAAAGAFEWLWPHHHGYWVSITVVIVVQRNLQTALMRTFHRAAGTTLGVLLTSLILVGSPNTWAMIAMIGALAAARPMLIETNYTAYAAVMTPLVILLLDFGQAPSWVVVVDRLVATLAGCTLALTLAYLAWSTLFPPAPASAENKRRI